MRYKTSENVESRNCHSTLKECWNMWNTYFCDFREILNTIFFVISNIFMLCIASFSSKIFHLKSHLEIDQNSGKLPFKLSLKIINSLCRRSSKKESEVNILNVFSGSIRQNSTNICWVPIILISSHSMKQEIKKKQVIYNII